MGRLHGEIHAKLERYDEMGPTERRERRACGGRVRAA